MDKWLGQIETDIIGDEFYFIVFKINCKGMYIVVNTKFMTQGLKTSRKFSMYHYNNNTYLITAFEPFILENISAVKKLSEFK